MNDLDVIIVGGGPAGSSAAIRLASSGVRVMIIEQERFPREKLCGEFISPECIEHFAQLDVLDRISNACGKVISKTVFFPPSGRRVAVPSSWFGTGERLALGLSRAEMDACLLHRAREAGAEVHEETACSGLLEDNGKINGAKLHTGNKAFERLAPIIIDATGRHRSLARRVETTEVSSDEKRRPSMVAFKAHLDDAKGEDGVCELYFYPGGYGGLSPIEGGRSNLCFIVRAKDARDHASDPEELMHRVVMRNSRAAKTLESARVKSRWLAVALHRFGRYDPVPAKGLITIGDAASFIDPFTGSGMLMALESGEIVAQSITHHLASTRRDDFASLANEYRKLYTTRFATRLRFATVLRRAAFAPRLLTELAACVFNINAPSRRIVARATRGRGPVQLDT